MEQNTAFENQGFSLCVRVRERLPELLEGYLDALTAEAIRAHLAVCYQCSREFKEMQQTVRLVESLPFVEPNRDFTPAIMAAIEQGSDHCFQTPVVEVETEVSLRFHNMPRTINGRQRLSDLVHQILLQSEVRVACA